MKNEKNYCGYTTSNYWEALQICRSLPMTDDDRKNPKEIIEKLEADLNPKRNAIYERYMFFSCDQKSN